MPEIYGMPEIGSGGSFIRMFKKVPEKEKKKQKLLAELDLVHNIILQMHSWTNVFSQTCKFAAIFFPHLKTLTFFRPKFTGIFFRPEFPDIFFRFDIVGIFFPTRNYLHILILDQKLPAFPPTGNCRHILRSKLASTFSDRKLNLIFFFLQCN